jgi:hypothetical protein
MPILVSTPLAALPPLFARRISAYNTALPTYNAGYETYIDARTTGIATYGSLSRWIVSGRAAPAIHGLLAAFGMNQQASRLVSGAALQGCLAGLPVATVDWIVGIDLPLPAGQAPSTFTQTASGPSLAEALCALYATLSASGAVTTAGGFVAASKTLHCLFPDLAPMIDGRHSGRSYYHITRPSYLPPKPWDWTTWCGKAVPLPNPSPRGAGRKNWQCLQFLAALGLNQHLYELWQGAYGTPGLSGFLALDPTPGTTGIPRVIDKVLW